MIKSKRIDIALSSLSENQMNSLNNESMKMFDNTSLHQRYRLDKIGMLFRPITAETKIKEFTNNIIALKRATSSIS